MKRALVGIVWTFDVVVSQLAHYISFQLFHEFSNMEIPLHHKQVHEKRIKRVVRIAGVGNVRRCMAIHLRHAPVLVMLHCDEIFQAWIAIRSREIVILSA